MSILKSARATRAARFIAVAGVVGASLIGLSSAPAEAATTPAATLSPATGSTLGGTVVTAKGKGFQDAVGANVLVTVTFQATACGVSALTGTAATSINVLSATGAVFVTPVLAANTYYACFFDGNGATQVLLGQGTIVIAAPPTATNLNGGATLGAPTTGASVVTVTGTNFTAKGTSATVDGLTAKTTYVSGTTISIVLPAHVAKVGVAVVVTTPYGSGTSTGLITYFAVLKLPSTSNTNGAAGVAQTIQGVGFASLSFGAPGTIASQQDVLFVPAGTTLTSGTTTIASLKACTNVIVVNDTTLTCKAPALSNGPYTVMVVQGDATDGSKYLSSTTTISKSATYTVAPF